VSEDIRRYLDELVPSIGRIVPPIDSDTLRRLHNARDYAAMLGWIKKSMNLELRVGLRVVDNSETHTPMWIEMPTKMPRYGTPAFHDTRVVVNACREILETKPFDWTVAGFAHELSHVVLSSLGHRLRQDEKAVDLTAMLLGYAYFVSDAQQTKIIGAFLSALLMLVMLPFGLLYWSGTRTEKSRLGYLTSEEARFAVKYIQFHFAGGGTIAELG
jgi:hypothetical protein